MRITVMTRKITNKEATETENGRTSIVLSVVFLTSAARAANKSPATTPATMAKTISSRKKRHKLRPQARKNSSRGSRACDVYRLKTPEVKAPWRASSDGDAYPCSTPGKNSAVARKNATEKSKADNPEDAVGPNSGRANISPKTATTT